MRTARPETMASTWMKRIKTPMRTVDVNADRPARTTNRSAILALAVAAPMVLATVAWAPGAFATVVDDFTTAQAQISAPPSSSSSMSGAGIVGADRDLAIERLEGADLVSAEVIGGVLEMADGNARARLVVTYDADSDPNVLDPVGLGGVDLTDGGAATGLRLVTTTVAADVDVTVTVYTDATLVSIAARRLNAAGTTVLDFGGFVATGSSGGADMGNVGAVVVELVTSVMPPPPPPLSAPETVLPTPVIEVDLIDTVGPTIAAIKDALDATGTTDVDPAAPGQTLTYRIEVENTGGTATNVSIADVIDSNLTVVADSLTTRPFAVDDLYQAIGNVQLMVDAAGGLLSNDRDVDDGAGPSSLSVTAFDATSTGGGTVSVAADGSFTYTSAGGFGGVDTFSYTVTDDEGQTDDGTVTVTVAATVWFVDNTVPPGGSGTAADPFHALASAEAASGPGDFIRVREGDGTDTNYDVGINLKPRQKLIGAGVDLVIAGQLIEAAAGTPIISHNDHVVDLADEVEIRGVAIEANALANEHGIRASGLASQIAISDVTITGNGNHGGLLISGNPGAQFALTDVDVTAGDETAVQAINAGTVTFAGACDLASAGRVMDFNITALLGTVGSLSGSTASFDGIDASSNFTVATATTLTDPSGTGLLVQNSPNVNLAFGTTSVTDTAIGAGASGTAVDLGTGNAGATIAFASLAIDADGAGLRTGAGTVDIADPASSIASTGGDAINADGTTLQANGASGWTLANITATNSNSRGLRFANTTGTVTVTGTTMVAGANTGAEFVSAGAFVTLRLDINALAGLVANASGQITVQDGPGSQVIATGSRAIDLGNTATQIALATVTSTSSATVGVRLVNHSGSFVATGGSITGAAEQAFLASLGAGTISYGGSITNSANRSVEITARSGGTVTLSGAINDTGTGILVANNGGGTSTFSGLTTLNTGPNDALTAIANAGHTVELTGGLDIDTSTGTGVVATAGGLVRVRNTVLGGAANTVTATGAQAIEADSVQTDMLWTSLSSTGSAAEGVQVTNAADQSVFGVSGSTTVDNATTAAILLSTAVGAGIDLDILGTVSIDSPGGEGIRIDRAATGTSPSDLDFGTVTIDRRGATGIRMFNLTGTADFASATVPNQNGVGGHGVHVEASSAAVSFTTAALSNTAVTNAEAFTNVTRPELTDDGADDGDHIFLRNNTGSFALLGGTLTNSADDALDLRNAMDVTLDGVTVSQTRQFAIQGRSHTGLTVQNSSFTRTGDDVASPGFLPDNTMWFTDLDGDLVLESSTIDMALNQNGTAQFVSTAFPPGASNTALFVHNRNVALDVTLRDATIRNVSNDGLQMVHEGTAAHDLRVLVEGTATGAVKTCLFDDLNGRMITVEHESAAGANDIHLTVRHCRFEDGGLAIRPASSGGFHNFLIENNQIVSLDTAGGVNDAIRPRAFSGTMRGRVLNNTIDIATSFVNLIATGGASAVFQIDGNSHTSNNIGSFGLVSQTSPSEPGNTSVDVQFTNNDVLNVDRTGEGTGGGIVQTSNTSGGTPRLCLDMDGNKFTGNPPSFGDGFFFIDKGAGTLELDGFGGGNAAAAAAFLNGQNQARNLADTADAPPFVADFDIFAGAPTGGTCTTLTGADPVPELPD